MPHTTLFLLRINSQVQLSGVTEWLVSNIATRILILTYKFRTANKTLPSLRIFVSRNPWHPFAEPSLRNTGWGDRRSLRFNPTMLTDHRLPDWGYVITNPDSKALPGCVHEQRSNLPRWRLLPGQLCAKHASEGFLSVQVGTETREIHIQAGNTSEQKQCAYNVTLKCVRFTIVAVKKTVLHILSVTFVIRHTMRMCPIILSSAASLALPYFSALSHTRHDFEELNMQFDFLYSFHLKHL